MSEQTKRKRCQQPELEFLDLSAAEGLPFCEKKHRCTECQALNRHAGESHTREGWCPSTQSFAARSKPATRLRSYFEAADTDEIGQQFCRAIRGCDVDSVAKLLKGRPELLLLRIETKRHSWSVWHEVVNLFSPSDGHDSPAAELLGTLLQVRNLRAPGLDLNHKQFRKSDSKGTPLHHAAYRGSMLAMERLLNAGADVFAETRSEWLPIHTVCLKHAPARATLDTLLPWLEDKMQGKKHLATYPDGFSEKHCTIPNRPAWTVACTWVNACEK